MSGYSVLDTSALINWPISSLDGGYVLDSQRLEVSRLSPERGMSLDAASLNWVSPTRESIDEATEVAVSTGDLDGLSETDLGLIALVIELGGHLHTDDYRMQNVCSAAGLGWSPVETRGINAIWSWELQCIGCGTVYPTTGKTRAASESAGECSRCGSELRVRKKR